MFEPTRAAPLVLLLVTSTVGQPILDPTFGAKEGAGGCKFTEGPALDADGNLYLNVGETPDEPLDGETLVQNVAAVLRRQPRKSVLVRGDHAVDYGTVVSAMVLLQQAGVPNIGLVTEPPEQ